MENSMFLDEARNIHVAIASRQIALIRLAVVKDWGGKVRSSGNKTPTSDIFEDCPRGQCQRTVDNFVLTFGLVFKRKGQIAKAL